MLRHTRLVENATVGLDTYALTAAAAACTKAPPLGLSSRAVRTPPSGADIRARVKLRTPAAPSGQNNSSGSTCAQKHARHNYARIRGNCAHPRSLTSCFSCCQHTDGTLQILAEQDFAHAGRLYPMEAAILHSNHQSHLCCACLPQVEPHSDTSCRCWPVEACPNCKGGLVCCHVDDRRHH